MMICYCILPNSDGYRESLVSLSFMLCGAGTHEHVPRAQSLGRGGAEAWSAARPTVRREPTQHRQRQLTRGSITRALRVFRAHVHRYYVLSQRLRITLLKMTHR